MKRFISLILLTLLVLASCTSPENPPEVTTEGSENETTAEGTVETTMEHKHEFTETSVEPTAEERGHILRTCTCGHTEKEYTTGIASVEDHIRCHGIAEIWKPFAPPVYASENICRHRIVAHLVKLCAYLHRKVGTNSAAAVVDIVLIELRIGL